ncbi:hypothetical protein D3C72_1979340 [compost metagenome]
MGNVNFQLAFGQVLATPKRIGLVLDAGRRAAVGDAPFLVAGHAGGNIVKFLEIVGPKELVKVQVAVVALGRLAVGAQEIQRGAIGQHQRIALQRDAQHVLGERNDVVAEEISLRAARR